ncbi:hypothetical protein KC19_VG289200 [Ceratodon purpureus]|uniref:Phosphoglycerate mutase n=1 Tax=Ceratodon purpureus TaxID=3225 RepID=A0A8T0HV98_CERPU|nr:hypothetical protein KC19_VG289200 [Ceratodon purpureus]
MVMAKTLRAGLSQNLRIHHFIVIHPLIHTHASAHRGLGCRSGLNSSDQSVGGFSSSHSAFISEAQGGRAMGEMAVSSNVAELLVVRHGETDWNALGRLQGHAKSDLNEAGKKQAQGVKFFAQF